LTKEPFGWFRFSSRLSKRVFGYTTGSGSFRVRIHTHIRQAIRGRSLILCEVMGQAIRSAYATPHIIGQALMSPYATLHMGQAIIGRACHMGQAIICPYPDTPRTRRLSATFDSHQGSRREFTVTHPDPEDFGCVSKSISICGSTYGSISASISISIITEALEESLWIRIHIHIRTPYLYP